MHGTPAPAAPRHEPSTAAPSLETEDEAEYPPHDDEPLDDGAEGDTVPPADAKALPPHPLDGKSSSELAALLASDPASLGSASIGSTNAGALFNGVQVPEGPHHTLVDAPHAWGTQETVDALLRSIARVQAEFPGAAPLPIGHVSGRRGGHLSPHVSHQSGRDVDVGYYYSAGGRWYARAHGNNLDRERTWAFVRALITETDVELILIDHSIQRLLEEHARRIGEDPAWLTNVFRGVPGRLPPLIRHAKGHATHLHVRFFNPIAQETGRRLFEHLLQQKLVEQPVSHLRHKVKPGETLGMLARKYRTTVPAIQRANGLRTTKIRAKKVYLIPLKQAPRALAAPRPVVVPPRRRPPARGAATLPEARAAPRIAP